MTIQNLKWANVKTILKQKIFTFCAFIPACRQAGRTLIFEF